VGSVLRVGQLGAGATHARAPTKCCRARRSQGDSDTYDALVGNETTMAGKTGDNNQIYHERTLWGARSVDTLLWSYPRSLVGQLNAAVEHSPAQVRHVNIRAVVPRTA
jgi:hypothetical protein